MKKRLLIVILDLLLILFIGLNTKWFTNLNAQITFSASFLFIGFIALPTIFIVFEAIAKKWEENTLKKQ